MNIYNFVKLLELRGNKLEKMLFDLKWPPPGNLPAILLDKISNGYEKGIISAQDVDKIFLNFYNKEKLEKLVGLWSEQDFIHHRIKIISEAVNAHIEGKYELSIPTLLPQLEGIIADIYQHTGRMTFKNITDYVETIFERDSRFDRVSKTFFQSIILEEFEWQGPVPFFSRNAILHGADINYATPANSLRLILMLDLLQSSVQYLKITSSHE